MYGWTPEVIDQMEVADIEMYLKAGRERLIAYGRIR